MSYVIAAPEMLATAAADVAGIGSSLNAANAAAIASLFSGHGQQFQALSARAAAEVIGVWVVPTDDGR